MGCYRNGDRDGDRDGDRKDEEEEEGRRRNGGWGNGVRTDVARFLIYREGGN